MRVGEVFERYGRYYDIIQALGNLPILETPELKKLEISTALKQSAYKEIKETNFPGSLVEYLYWISTKYVLNSIRKELQPEASLTDWAIAIIDNYDKYKPDVRNLLRLFNCHRLFYVFIKSEIKGLPFNGKEIPEQYWGETDDFLDLMGSSCILSGLIELLLFQDTFNKLRDDHDIIIQHLTKRPPPIPEI